MPHLTPKHIYTLASVTQAVYRIAVTTVLLIGLLRHKRRAPMHPPSRKYH